MSKTYIKTLEPKMMNQKAQVRETINKLQHFNTIDRETGQLNKNKRFVSTISNFDRFINQKEKHIKNL